MLFGQRLHELAACSVRDFAAHNPRCVESRVPAFGRTAVRTVWVLLVAIKERTGGDATGQFSDGRGVLLYFRVSCARRQAKLVREDVEDAGETDESCVFGDGAAGKLTVIELTTLLAHGRAHMMDTSAGVNSESVWPKARSSSAATSPVADVSFLKSNSSLSSK